MEVKLMRRVVRTVYLSEHIVINDALIAEFNEYINTSIGSNTGETYQVDVTPEQFAMLITGEYKEWVEDEAKGEGIEFPKVDFAEFKRIYDCELKDAIWDFLSDSVYREEEGYITEDDSTTEYVDDWERE